jgi:eukaryotic-like serine/threonine-protein kinase
VLCAAGQPAEGLPYLEASLRAVAAASSAVAPSLARLRAVAGLCALPLGRRADAQTWARQARQAFVRQPGVSDWYRVPLRRLEAALAGAGA